MRFLAVLLLVAFCDHIAGKAIEPVEAKPSSLKYQILNILRNGNLTEVIANLNDYTDKLLVNLDNIIIESGLDPAQLPDLDEKIQLLLILGELKLTNGWVADLSSLHRNLDVLLTYDESAKVTIVIPLAFNELSINYDYSAKVLYLGPSGGVQGEVSDVQFTVTITFDLEAFQMSLDDFLVTNEGHVNLNFTGNALIDWLLDWMSNAFTTIFNGIIMAIVETVIKGELQNAIDTVNSLLAELKGV